jgi:glycerol-3-phosphate dehydrogenase (NAD(P)+)
MLTEALAFASRRPSNYFTQVWHFPTNARIDTGAGRKRVAPYNAAIATGMD